MYLGRRTRRVAGVAAVAVTAAMVAAGCGSSGSSGSSTGAKMTGGTATWAEPPGAAPNWVWPFIPLTNYSVYNAQTFEWLMYRPLYMFGNNGSSLAVNYPLSLANAPTYSGSNISLTMKGWKWSNGESVTGNDVVFWLNMMEAEKTNFAGWSPGTLPDNLTTYKASGNTVTMTTDKPYSSYWFTYNQLAEITPMPMTWDVTSLGAAPGSGGCTTDSAAADKWAKCKAVFTFLTAQAKATSTYASSSIWGTVDGPWKMSAFSASGNVTFVPNKTYSGSPKPTIAVFKEVPYTADSTEYTALKTNNLDVGYVPSNDLPIKTSGVLPPTNPLGTSYTLAPGFVFGIFYGVPNLNNPTIGPAFRQLYVRQALQLATDQPAIDKAIWHGYAFPTSGAAPAQPTNQWTAPDQSQNGGQGLYGFDLTKAKAALTSHGWTEVGGVMTCTSPGTAATDCGAGVAKGLQLKFTAYYSSGTAATAQQVAVIKSDYSKVGIDMNIVGQSFNTILGETAQCKVGPKCLWQMSMAGGWVFNGPGFEPTGEPLFQTGAASNGGSFTNPEEDTLINETHTSSSLAVFHQYAAYTDQQLPVVWQPNPYTIYATSSKLHNVTFNPLGGLYPEYWYFTK
ncbi:MAG TPA: ABC transporter substrate-binding protein [Streptosporangiaceae bacterium]|nr:ABC transporter substrate-binding protein [Streptosporangiaceae bacterium]